MAEGTFEYECMRAELLGLENPKLEEFEAAKKLKLEVEQDEIENEQLKEISLDDEQINSTTGKLDELNSILSITQNKINKFKKTCGSLTNLLKFRPTPTGSAAGSNENLAAASNGGTSINDALDTLDAMKDAERETNVQVIKKTSADMSTKISSQIDKLDSMLTKAESASYQMEKQNKQMKRILD